MRYIDAHTHPSILRLSLAKFAKMTSKNIPEGLPTVFLANNSNLLVSFNASDSKENMCSQIRDRRKLLVTAVDGILGDVNVSRSRKVAELHNKQTRVLCVCGCE